MAAILGLLVFALAAPALALRPQLFGIAIFAALLWLVAMRTEHPRWLWAAPLLVVLWANIHGSFVLAPLVLGYAWLDDVARKRPQRQSLSVLVIGLLATFVTPFGPGVWAYAAGIGGNPAITDRVSEWQRTTPLTVPGALFYASAIGTLLVMWRGRPALRWPDWLWTAGMLAIGAWTVRGLAWWPFAAAFVVAAALPLVLASLRPGGAVAVARPASLVGAIFAFVFVLAIVAALPWWRPADPLTGRVGLLSYAPSGLALAVATRVPPDAKVFVPQTWASWFEWAARAPHYYLDSRFELFPADVWADYAADRAGWTRGAGRPRPMGRDRPRAAGGVRGARGVGAGLRGRRWRGAAPRRRGRPRPAGTFGRPGGPDGLCYGRPTGEIGSMTQGRTATDTRPPGPALLDIVVLGGGGHVGPAAQPRVRRRRPARRHLRHQRR